MNGTFTPSLIKYSMALAVSMACVALVNMDVINTSINNIVLVSFHWVSVLYVSYFLKKRSNNNVSDDNVIILLISLNVLMSYFNMSNVSAGRLLSVNSIYWLVLCFPLILKLKIVVLRYSLVLFVLVATAASLKRTAIIAIVLGLSTYGIIKGILNMKLKRSSTISLILVLITAGIVVYSYDYYSEKYHFDLYKRFISLEVDDGSGRGVIYKDVVDLQFKSNILGWVFGHGQGAVIMNTFSGKSAHNDFLEVLFDYGIFAFLLYLGIYHQLLRLLIRMLSVSSDLAAPLGASIVIFITVSLFSHLIIYPTYFVLLCLFWGISLAEYENEENAVGRYL